MGGQERAEHTGLRGAAVEGQGSLSKGSILIDTLRLDIVNAIGREKSQMPTYFHLSSAHTVQYGYTAVLYCT